MMNWEKLLAFGRFGEQAKGTSTDTARSEFEVDYDHLDINMVFVKSTIDFRELATYLVTKDIIIGGYKGEYLRIAIHNDITVSHIELLLASITEFLER